jgi:hypothetical protein
MTLATINLRSVAQNETIVPSNDNSGPARLSEALQLADSGLSLGDRFFDTVFRAAHQAGCELLFEIPTVLFREESSRAAAVRSAGDDEGEFFYVLFSESEGAVSIVDAAEVGESVVDFTRSYAGVLNLIGSDREIITPLLQ